MAEAKNEMLVIKDYGVPSTASREALLEEFDGLPMSIERIKIPSAGGVAFEVPGENPDDPDMVKVLEAVIVDKYPVNSYFAKEYTGEKVPPDCSSTDGKLGYAPPESVVDWAGGSNHCATCHLNQFGSDPKGGKACANKYRLYLLFSGDMFPKLLTLPAGSLKAYGDYARRIVGKGYLAHQVLTKITLKKERSNGGIEYSQAQFAMAGVLSPEEQAKIAEYASSIKAMTRVVPVTSESDVVTVSGDYGM